MVLSHKLASLHELQTIYGYSDLLDMVETLLITSYNEHIAHEIAKIRAEKESKQQ